MSTLCAEPLSDRVARLITSGELELPPLPELAIKLRAAVDDESTRPADIASLIRTEPAVAAMLLRAANSAAFGGLKAITHLTQAIGRLGIGRAQTLVTGLVAQAQFQCAPDERNARLALWNHAVASATAARMLAEREGYPQETAFVAGLLHGLGRLIVSKALDDLETNDPELRLTNRARDEIVEQLQFQIGYTTLKSWNLEEDVCEAARAMCPDSRRGELAITTIVRASDVIAQKLGLHPFPDDELELMDDDAIESLDLSDIELAALLVDLEDEIEEVYATLSA